MQDRCRVELRTRLALGYGASVHSGDRILRPILVVGACLGLSLTGIVGCESAPPTTTSAAIAAVASSGFLTSDECARCHSRSLTANALTTASGDDASPFGLWRATPMANAFRDPYWRAQMAREIENAPDSRARTEELCLRCHAPMASHAADLAGRASASMQELLLDPLAHDGVSC